MELPWKSGQRYNNIVTEIREYVYYQTSKKNKVIQGVKRKELPKDISDDRIYVSRTGGEYRLYRGKMIVGVLHNREKKRTH